MEYGVCEIGYCYGEKYWGMGFATEALRRVIKFLFEECDADLVCAEHLSLNFASGKVMIKSGMIYEGTKRGRLLDADGIRNDLLIYSITKEEYINNKTKMTKKELIKLIDSLKIDLEECWVLSSSALVLRDLFPVAGDLDLAVTEKGLEQLKQNYDLKQKENGWYIVNDKVECVLDTKEPYKIEKYGKYNLESLEKYYEYLKNSTREKDKMKYEIVKKKLNK